METPSVEMPGFAFASQYLHISTAHPNDCLLSPWARYRGPRSVYSFYDLVWFPGISPGARNSRTSVFSVAAGRNAFFREHAAWDMPFSLDVAQYIRTNNRVA